MKTRYLVFGAVLSLFGHFIFNVVLGAMGFYAITDVSSGSYVLILLGHSVFATLIDTGFVYLAMYLLSKYMHFPKNFLFESWSLGVTSIVTAIIFLLQIEVVRGLMSVQTDPISNLFIGFVLTFINNIILYSVIKMTSGDLLIICTNQTQEETLEEDLEDIRDDYPRSFVNVLGKEKEINTLLEKYDFKWLILIVSDISVVNILNNPKYHMPTLVIVSEEVAESYQETMDTLGSTHQVVVVKGDGFDYMSGYDFLQILEDNTL